MTQRILTLALSALSIQCTTHHVVHTHKIVENPRTPFEAVKETSQCFVDRATFDGDKHLKSSFSQTAASEIVTRFKMNSYESEEISCTTVNGTGRSVVVYMCPNGTEIKDHYCYD